MVMRTLESRRPNFYSRDSIDANRLWSQMIDLHGEWGRKFFLQCESWSPSPVAFGRSDWALRRSKCHWHSGIKPSPALDSIAAIPMRVSRRSARSPPDSSFCGPLSHRGLATARSRQLLFFVLEHIGRLRLVEHRSAWTSPQCQTAAAAPGARRRGRPISTRHVEVQVEATAIATHGSGCSVGGTHRWCAGHGDVLRLSHSGKAVSAPGASNLEPL